MRMEKPQCNFQNCKYCFDGNCRSVDKYENCKLTDLHCDIARLTVDLDNAKTEWISVEERLPRSEQMVLCYTPCDGFMFVGFYHEVKPNPYYKSYWNIITAMRSTKKMTKKVTHWMPLPEAPKTKGDKTDA